MQIFDLILQPRLLVGVFLGTCWMCFQQAIVIMMQETLHCKHMYNIG